ncbi:hypothetical protein P154DRAFT_420264, partial [Amniculicola lignicola CBS 123094]
TKRRCSAYSKGRFCSKLYKDKVFVNYLFIYSKRQLTSVDYLWKLLAKDLIPIDKDVL